MVSKRRIEVYPWGNRLALQCWLVFVTICGEKNGRAGGDCLLLR